MQPVGTAIRQVMNLELGTLANLLPAPALILQRRAVRFAGMLLLLTWFAAELVPPATSQTVLPNHPDNSEYQVKAVFLLNFTKFIEWPPEGGNTPFTICVFDDDPFGPVLDQVIDGESVGSRRLTARRLRGMIPPEGSRACQVLFLSKNDKGQAKVLASLGPGTLTVGDSGTFLDEGGMIGFVLENKRVRFDVNLRQAPAAGLQISSRLLNVARRVIQ
jgi:hypothetical protein